MGVSTAFRGLVVQCFPLSHRSNAEVCPWVVPKANRQWTGYSPRLDTAFALVVWRCPSYLRVDPVCQGEVKCLLTPEARAASGKARWRHPTDPWWPPGGCVPLLFHPNRAAAQASSSIDAIWGVVAWGQKRGTDALLRPATQRRGCWSPSCLPLLLIIHILKIEISLPWRLAS